MMTKRITNKQIKKILNKIESKLENEFFEIYIRDKITWSLTLSYAFLTVAILSISIFFPTKNIYFIYFGLIILGLAIFTQLWTKHKIKKEKKNFYKKRSDNY